MPSTKISMTSIDSQDQTQTAQTVQHTPLEPKESFDLDDSPRETDEELESTEDEYPEGGLKAWSVVFGCFCGLFVALAPMNAIGTFQSYISTHQLANYDLNSVGWIFSLYSFVALFVGAQIGPLFDAFGPRILNAVGSVLAILQMGLLGICENYGEFLFVYAILGGLMSSIMLTSCVSTVSHYFNKRRGFATGMAISGGSLGGLVVPFMFNSLLKKLSFAWTTRCFTLLIIVLLCFCNLLVSSRFRSTTKFNIRKVIIDPRVYLDTPVMLLCIGLFFTDGALFVPLSYITSYSLDNGINETISYQMLAYLNAGSMFGRLIPGFLSDRLGRFNMMIFNITLCAIFAFAIWLPANGNEAATIVYSVAMGFASGSNISLVPVCLGQLCDVRDYGRYYSSGMAVASIGALIGNPISGKIVDASNGSYTGLICFTGAFYVCALGFFIATRVNRVGFNPKIVY